ncbi:transglutaminase family protein [Acidisoma silvae]|uniref:Transglutaminase family protein n=1 Tax=Acidisoma silvae TaxID=2802396 RepID=A0A963YTP9_9PROT|nr:transglutaminase-like domain-containing protein [Acidisoma silvae]MCB8876245.1 transglutaminase family protein [Acidisoma silvae]
MIRAALDAVGQLPDSEIALADTALLLARLDQPDADWRRAQKHLSQLARDCIHLRDTSGSWAEEQAQALAAMLVSRYGYSGDYETYDDLQNLNLIAVTERRRGMPIGLGIIWLHCAEVAGWDCYGINFPSHFVLGLDGDDGQILLDIFADGRVLEPEDLEGMLARIGDGRRRQKAAPALTVRMTKREVLIRLQQNISYRREQSGDLAGALRAVEDMLRFAPSDINLWQQAAGIHQQMGQIAAAVRCMGHVVELIPPGADLTRARAVMRRLRSSLN